MSKKEFVVGDKVFDLRKGNGVVINTAQTTWPVLVKFEDEQMRTYTEAGMLMSHDIFPLLFHGHDLIVEVKEPVYEYQVLFKLPSGTYELTVDFHTSAKGWNAECYATLFEPSKRLRK